VDRERTEREERKNKERTKREQRENKERTKREQREHRINTTSVSAMCAYIYILRCTRIQRVPYHSAFGRACLDGVYRASPPVVKPQFLAWAKLGGAHLDRHIFQRQGHHWEEENQNITFSRKKIPQEHTMRITTTRNPKKITTRRHHKKKKIQTKQTIRACSST